MKLDPNLLRELLDVETSEPGSLSARQWLGFSSQAAPGPSEIQAAYDARMGRLKQAVDRYDQAQLKLVAKQLRQAALELQPTERVAGSRKAASTKSKTNAADARIAEPVPEPPQFPSPDPASARPAPPMAKPIAIPVAMTAPPVPSPAGKDQETVSIDTRRPIRRKKKVPWGWLGLTAVLLLVTGWLLGQMGVVPLPWSKPAVIAQLSTDSRPAAVDAADANPSDRENLTAARSDAANAETTGGSGLPKPFHQSPAPSKPSNHPRTTEPQAGNRPATDRPATNRPATDRPAGNLSLNPQTIANASRTSAMQNPLGDPQDPNRIVTEVPADQAILPWIEKPLDMAAMSAQQWYTAACRVESCLACVALEDDAAFQRHRQSLEALGPATLSLVRMLDNIDRADKIFDRMWAQRLPLVERVGELPLGSSFIAIRSLRPNEYRFRINGESRDFDDRTLPLAIRLAIFHGVKPEFPMDDQFLHVLQCLPYLAGDPSLKSSLLERLSDDADPSSVNLFPADSTGRVLSQWIQSNGSVSLLFAQHQSLKPVEGLAPGKVPDLTMAEDLDRAVHLELADSDAMLMPIRKAQQSAALQRGDLRLAIAACRDQMVWTDDVEGLKVWVSAMIRRPDRDNWEKWMAQLEQELKDPHNSPELNQLLIQLGGRIAGANGLRPQQVQWRQRLSAAAGE